MDSNKRTIVKTLSYRTVVAVSIFLAALAMNYSAGFGITFVIISYTIGFVSFWIQEKLWNMVRWQRIDSKDTRIRSIAKTFSWRFFIFLYWVIFGYVYTGTFIGAGILGI